MEKSYSFTKREVLDRMSLKGTSIKYGKESKAIGRWKTIIEEKDDAVRNSMIDDFIEEMELNSENNGFWKSDDEIKITLGAGADNAIRLNDKTLYYDFFKMLRHGYIKNNEKATPNSEGWLALHAIKNMIDFYFGSFNGDLKKREVLTTMDYDSFEFPSISVLKGAGCGACVEKSAVAHNLWLMLGRESYYVASASSKFPHSQDEGHAFCIIKNSNGNFMLFDHAMQNFGQLPGDPIDLLLSGNPLIIGEPFKNTGCYANALNLEQNMDIV